MSGQRLAHFFRNSVQSRNWMTAARRMGPLSKVGQSCLCMPGLVEVREPQEPRKVVEMVLREARALYSLRKSLSRAWVRCRPAAFHPAFGRIASVHARIYQELWDGTARLVFAE